MKVIEWWRQLEASRRLYLGAGVAGILVLTAVFAYFALRESYVPLLSDGATGDNASIIARLDASGAAYKVEPGSGRILVPEEQRDKLKAVLVDSGAAPRQPKGFEVFDNSDFGMTEFSQRINYERGLEGELTRTIMALDGVRYARLHLVLPESTLFQRDKDQPKASVTLMLAPGKSLSPKQIAGIRELVAYAVPQLKSDMVSIHDYRGIDLSPRDDADEEPSSNAMHGRIKAQEAIETYLAAKIYDVLVPLYPPGSVTVSVDAALRLDHVSSVRDETLPKAIMQPAIAHQRGSASIPVVHVPPASPMPASATPPPPAPVTAPASQAASGEYGIDRVHQQIEEVPGAIERLSVSVVVPNGSPQNLSVEELRELISGAIGANAERGDVITVQAATMRAGFSAQGSDGSLGGSHPLSADSTATEQKANRPPLRQMLIPAILIGLCGIVIAFWAGRRSREEGTRLTATERELLLGKIRDWLRQEKDPGQVSG